MFDASSRSRVSSCAQHMESDYFCLAQVRRLGTIWQFSNAYTHREQKTSYTPSRPLDEQNTTSRQRTTQHIIINTPSSHTILSTQPHRMNFFALRFIAHPTCCCCDAVRWRLRPQLGLSSLRSCVAAVNCGRTVRNFSSDDAHDDRTAPKWPIVRRCARFVAPLCVWWRQLYRNFDIPNRGANQL